MPGTSERAVEDAMTHARCDSKLPWIGDRVCDCAKPLGHHGVHRCVCDTEWLNKDDFTPCPSTATAVLGVMGSSAELRCGLQADHSGPHRFSMEWTGGIPIDGRRIGRGSSFGYTPKEQNR